MLFLNQLELLTNRMLAPPRTKLRSTRNFPGAGVPELELARGYCVPTKPKKQAKQPLGQKVREQFLNICFRKLLKIPELHRITFPYNLGYEEIRVKGEECKPPKAFCSIHSYSLQGVPWPQSSSAAHPSDLLVWPVPTLFLLRSIQYIGMSNPLSANWSHLAVEGTCWSGSTRRLQEIPWSRRQSACPQRENHPRKISESDRKISFFKFIR